MDRKLIALAIIIGVGVGNACAQRPPHLRGMGGTSAAQPSDSSGIGMGGTTSCLWIPIVTATGTEWSLYCGFYLKLSVDTSGVGSGGT